MGNLKDFDMKKELEFFENILANELKILEVLKKRVRNFQSSLRQQYSNNSVIPEIEELSWKFSNRLTELYNHFLSRQNQTRHHIKFITDSLLKIEESSDSFMGEPPDEWET